MDEEIYTDALTPGDIHWLSNRDKFTPKEIEILSGNAKRVSNRQLDKLVDKLEKMDAYDAIEQLTDMYPYVIDRLLNEYKQRNAEHPVEKVYANPDHEKVQRQLEATFEMLPEMKKVYEEVIKKKSVPSEPDDESYGMTGSILNFLDEVTWDFKEDFDIYVKAVYIHPDADIPELIPLRDRTLIFITDTTYIIHTGKADADGVRKIVSGYLKSLSERGGILHGKRFDNPDKKMVEEEADELLSNIEIKETEDNKQTVNV